MDEWTDDNDDDDSSWEIDYMDEVLSFILHSFLMNFTYVDVNVWIFILIKKRVYEKMLFPL